MTIKRTHKRNGNTIRTGHRRKRVVDKELLALLVPVIPIVVLLILIINLQNQTPDIKEEAFETVEIETETILSKEETDLLEYETELHEYEQKIENYVSEYSEFGVIVSDGTVNFRRTPNSIQDNKIGELSDLEVVDVLDEEGDWYKIDRNGTVGYVSKEYCLTGEQGKRAASVLVGIDKISKFTQAGVILTEGNDVKVYSDMHTNDLSLIIGQMLGGDAFELLERKDNGWYKIRSGGMEGYILSSRTATGEQALKIAKVKSKNRLYVLSSVMSLRSDPSFKTENRIGEIYKDEYFEVVDFDTKNTTEGGWVRIKGDFNTDDQTAYVNIGSNDAKIVLGLKEAKKADAKALVTEEYKNLIVCTTSGYVNVRTGTDTSSYKNIVGKIYSGAGAELLDVVEPSQSKDGKKWYHIKSGDVSGYVSAGDDTHSYFATGNEANELAINYAHLTASITADRLNVRSTPSLDDNSNVWTQVTKGQAYEVLEQDGEWVKIDLGTEDANDAYIYKGDSFIRIAYGLDEAIEFSYAEKASAFRQSVVDYACKYIGNPYVWGGNSLTKGCDCSGFVQQVMKHFGISMERASYYQAKQGTKRTSKTMRPGDLIFYANSSGTVNHVVIYIGGGYMVGAQSKRAGIKVYKWNYRTPVAIRDVIGDRVE